LPVAPAAEAVPDRRVLPWATGTGIAKRPHPFRLGGSVSVDTAPQPGTAAGADATAGVETEVGSGVAVSVGTPTKVSRTGVKKFELPDVYLDSLQGLRGNLDDMKAVWAARSLLRDAVDSLLQHELQVLFNKGSLI